MLNYKALFAAVVGASVLSTNVSAKIAPSKSETIGNWTQILNSSGTAPQQLVFSFCPLDRKARIFMSVKFEAPADQIEAAIKDDKNDFYQTIAKRFKDVAKAYIRAGSIATTASFTHEQGWEEFHQTFSRLMNANPDIAKIKFEEADLVLRPKLTFRGFDSNPETKNCPNIAKPA